MYSVKIKVNKNVVRLVSLILLTILIIPIFRTVIPFVLLLYSIDLFLIFTKKDKWAIYFFIMCCIMQNLVCIIFSEYLSSFETQLIVFVKELLVYGFVFVRAFKNICGYKRIRNIDIVALLFVIISLMYMFFSSVSFTAQILGWRQLAVPIMCFYFGNFASIKYEEVKDIFNAEYEVPKNEHDKLIFGIVNGYNIRHNRAGQNSDYSKEIWYDWMMQYYTSVIIAFYKLKNKHNDIDF